jgi:hypothetical protein
MPDLLEPYNDPALASAQTGYETAANTASQYQTASQMLPAALKSAINEKLDFNKTLIEAKNKSMTDYFNAPSQARADYQDIFNPFQREALVQKATNNAYLPYQNNADILTQRLGSISDIIGQATNSFSAQTTSAKDAATLALQKYNNLFSMAGVKSDATYKNAQLALEYYKANKTGGGGSDKTWDRILQMANFNKATQTQEKQALDAQTGLDSIKTIKDALALKPNLLQEIKNPFQLWGLNDPVAQKVKRNLQNLADLNLTRPRTGAALNAQEQKFYDNFLVNPTEAVLGYTAGSNEALALLEKSLTGYVNQAKNPYAGLLDSYMQLQYGVDISGAGSATNNDPLGIR